jgi:hypothetical protein
MSNYNREDAEAFRSKRREEDRRDRGEYSPSGDRRKSFESEREQRMARLREEMKEEDAELSALDTGKDREDAKPKPQETIIEVNQDELEGLDEEEQMKLLMGIQGFGTTKGKEVKDNKSSAARGVAAKHKARKYRQYMNRKNGFNRPLENMN